MYMAATCGIMMQMYEKMGYHRTGQMEQINDHMTIVYYEKD